MKKICLFYTVIFMLAGCGKNDVFVPEDIYTILQENDIRDSTITKLGKYDACNLEHVNIEVNKREVDEYVSKLLEGFAEIIEIKDRNVVEKNDVVYISSNVFYENEIINIIESEALVVGAKHYNEQIEKELIGKTVGTPFWVEIITMEGKKLDYEITIESINYFKTYELTESFVREKMGLQTVDEFYEYCYDNIYTDKESIQQEYEKRKLFTEIFNLCEYSFNTEEIALYSKYLIQQEEKLAYAYNLDLETYVANILHMELDEFYQQTYEYGEYEIKEYLTIGAIFHDLDLTISDEEFEDMCIKMELDYDKVQSVKYTNAMVNYSIMQNKVLDFFNKKGDD